MRTNNDKIARTLLPLVAGASYIVALLVAMDAIAGLNHPSPRIGDMVAFIAAQEQPAEGGVRLAAHRPDRFGCVLDLNTLRHSGGSVVVEGEVPQAPGSFRVHWAGERTTTDTGNCGADADLILDSHALDALASATVRYGADPLRSLVLVSQSGI